MYPPAIQITRTGLLAAVSVVVATCSVAVTLAVAGGGDGTDEIAKQTPQPSTTTASMERRR
jgi:hypothetical protein